MSKLWLPEKFKREKELLHTSSDGKKQCVSAELHNPPEADHSFHAMAITDSTPWRSVIPLDDDQGCLNSNQKSDAR